MLNETNFPLDCSRTVLAQIGYHGNKTVLEHVRDKFVLFDV